MRPTLVSIKLYLKYLLLQISNNKCHKFYQFGAIRCGLEILQSKRHKLIYPTCLASLEKFSQFGQFLPEVAPLSA